MFWTSWTCLVFWTVWTQPEYLLLHPPDLMPPNIPVSNSDAFRVGPCFSKAYNIKITKRKKIKKKKKTRQDKMEGSKQASKKENIWSLGTLHVPPETEFYPLLMVAGPAQKEFSYVPTSRKGCKHVCASAPYGTENVARQLRILWRKEWRNLKHKHLDSHLVKKWRSLPN